MVFVKGFEKVLCFCDPPFTSFLLLRLCCPWSSVVIGFSWKFLLPEMLCSFSVHRSPSLVVWVTLFQVFRHLQRSPMGDCGMPSAAAAVGWALLLVDIVFLFLQDPEKVSIIWSILQHLRTNLSTGPETETASPLYVKFPEFKITNQLFEGHFNPLYGRNSWIYSFTLW